MEKKHENTEEKIISIRRRRNIIVDRRRIKVKNIDFAMSGRYTMVGTMRSISILPCTFLR